MFRTRGIIFEWSAQLSYTTGANHLRSQPSHNVSQGVNRLALAEAQAWPRRSDGRCRWKCPKSTGNHGNREIGFLRRVFVGEKVSAHIRNAEHGMFAPTRATAFGRAADPRKADFSGCGLQALPRIVCAGICAGICGQTSTAILIFLFFSPKLPL